MFKKLAFSVVLLTSLWMAISWPTITLAGGCRTCATPVVVDTQLVPVAVPVFQTVAIPTISYAWNGGYPAGTYSPILAAPPTVVAPPAIAQPVAQPVTAAPQTSALLRLSDGELDLLIDRIEKRLNERAGKATTKPLTPPPVAPPTTAAPPPQSGSDNDVVNILTRTLYTEGGKAMSCAACHTGNTAKKAFKIFLSPGVLNPNANWAKIWDKAYSGDMPPVAATNKDAALSDQECEVLRQKMLQVAGMGR